MNLSQKIIANHLLSGTLAQGQEISLRIDQTLTQDATGTMAYLQFEAMGIPRVKTKKSLAYIDHNTLQSGFENADDHKYIQTTAKKHGIWFSRPGNGICHQVHLERFAVPGETLLGSDSHTPTCGAMAMIAMGAGGLDVAVAMGGGAYYLTMPKICRVQLQGKLSPMVSAKDVILEILRRRTVKGGVGYIMEYAGAGLTQLSVPERATIANMGAELGATTSIFPSDHITRQFLKAQGREQVWQELQADADAIYEEEMLIDLSQIQPLIAQPHSPDNVVTVNSLAGKAINQVAIGSCTNSSYADMMKVAAILDGHTVADTVSLVIAPGSMQVLTMLAANGALAKMVAAGARILESACGPCIGMGQSPQSGGVSLRTFNRNFRGRSGTADAEIYLVGPETAAVSALTGVITDPRDFRPVPPTLIADTFPINDNLIIPPATTEEAEAVEIIRGVNIKPLPAHQSLAATLSGKILIKLGDNISTDHIMPSNARLLPYRSNVPYLADFCLTPCDPEFPARAKQWGGGIIIGGNNYGQGSSREHAALTPLYLGVKAVIAKSFARIHAANLINNGILPLTFADPIDYDSCVLGEIISIENTPAQLKTAAAGTDITATISGRTVILKAAVTERQAQILTAGGLLNFTGQEK